MTEHSQSSPVKPPVPESLGFDILMTMDTAVLRRLAPRIYQFCGMVPYFYTQLFPQEEDGSNCSSPWNYSPMLEYFLEEIEDFFQQDQEPGAQISSGIWIEEVENGEELPLTATARVMHGEQILLIRAIREEYAERARILRKARVEILERRKISDALSTFKKKSLYDALTQLYNRGTFMEILQNQIANLRTYAPNLALLMLDIDNFKNVNDTQGHVVGDEVLTQIGKILRGSLRKNDAPVRYGGEEFAVITPNTNLAQSLQVAEKLRSKVETHDFGLGGTLTISVGCTIYRPGESSKEFIARADMALYDAKRQGKNRVCQRDPWSIMSSSDVQAKDR